jgi:hypothetical protein
MYPGISLALPRCPLTTNTPARSFPFYAAMLISTVKKEGGLSDSLESSYGRIVCDGQLHVRPCAC